MNVASVEKDRISRIAAIGTVVERRGAKKDAQMVFYEFVVIGLGLLASLMVAVLLFCRLEMAPGIARELARSTRFSGIAERSKLVRFW